MNNTVNVNSLYLYFNVYYMTSILELEKEEVAERFDGPDEFAEAIVEEKKEEFQDMNMPLEKEEQERLFKLYKRSVKTKEIWE